MLFCKFFCLLVFSFDSHYSLECFLLRGARWHTGMSSTSGSGDLSSNLGKGDIFILTKRYSIKFEFNLSDPKCKVFRCVLCVLYKNIQTICNIGKSQNPCRIFGRFSYVYVCSVQTPSLRERYMSTFTYLTNSLSNKICIILKYRPLKKKSLKHETTL